MKSTERPRVKLFLKNKTIREDIVFENDKDTNQDYLDRRKEIIRQIQAKNKEAKKESDSTRVPDPPKERTEPSLVESLKYISHQRELLNQDELQNTESEPKGVQTPDMFSSNVKQAKTEKSSEFDLGLSNTTESIGYYIPKENEIINKKYKVIGVCGKGIFSSVVKIIDINSNEMFAMKVIRNIDIMKASGEKERMIIKKLNQDDLSDKHFIIRLVNTLEFNSHSCLIFPLYKMNLRDLIKQTKSRGISVEKLKEISKQLVLAFILIHKNRFIHADCK